MKKTVATILLSTNDCYICRTSLPEGRPSWDKQWLRELVRNEDVSVHGYKLLPKSIRNLVGSISNEHRPYPLSIPEIDKYADILIVVRANSKCLKDGKKFRLDKFNQLIKTKEIEVWIRK